VAVCRAVTLPCPHHGWNGYRKRIFREHRFAFRVDSDEIRSGCMRASLEEDFPTERFDDLKLCKPNCRN
jgi:hypothetical protein